MKHQKTILIVINQNLHLQQSYKKISKIGNNIKLGNQNKLLKEKNKLKILFQEKKRFKKYSFQ